MLTDEDDEHALQHAELQGLIKKYFAYGYKYDKIRDLLRERHGIQISLRTFKRKIQSMGLRRKNAEESPIEQITAAIMFECAESGSQLGYRSLWSRLKKEHNIDVKRDTVSDLQGLIDPEGKELRKRRKLKRRIYNVPGPNYMIHVDGHDKLRVLEIYIHGAIDGYSRKVLWLKAANTNKNPKVVASYFIQAIKKYKCLPAKLRTDKGTENVMIAKIQRALRYEHDDEDSGMNSFFWSKSVHNQRIESFWGQLINHCTAFWMQYYKNLVHENILDLDNDIHKEIFKYCYGDIFQYDLDRTRKEWNNHKIRYQPNRNVITGEPNYIYYCPEKFGGENCAKPFSDEDIDLIYNDPDSCIQAELYCRETKEFVERIAPQSMLNPSTVEEAERLYSFMINHVNQYDTNSISESQN